jgi:hypothetical protein
MEEWALKAEPRIAGLSLVVRSARSTTLRVLPLHRLAGEEPALRPASTWILPRVRGGGSPKAVEAAA